MTNLIGISGKINSGKDLVGRIIQYLATVEDSSITEAIRRNIENEQLLANPIFKIKKFEDKLKDIICLLTGCTKEQLEDQKFKDNYIPFSIKYKTGIDDYPYAEEIEEPWGTYRDMLQYIGINLFRERFIKDIWISSLFVDYKQAIGYKYLIDYKKQKIGEPIPTEWYPHWIITDVKFFNEAEAIKNRGGVVIKVNRPILQTLKDNKVGIDKVEHSQHRSEAALDEYKHFDYVIENDGTIEELIIKVKEVLVKGGICDN